jgi:hypothetical protein
VWWRKYRERIRLILNAPRCFIVAIVFMVAFGRVCVK